MTRIASIIVVFLAVAAAARAAVFVPLGDLPGDAFHSEATHISADGSTVVGWSMSSHGREAFRWTREGGMVGLGSLPNGNDSIASDASADGSLIVGFSDNSAQNGLQAEGFYWTAAEGMQPLGFLPGGAESRARAVSDNGNTVVGWSRTGNGIEGFRWSKEQGMTALGDLDGGSIASAAQAVSADGNYIVGYGTTDFGRQPVQWTAAGVERLGHGEFDEIQGAAWEVNPDGSAIGEVTDFSGRQPVVFHQETFPYYESLNDLPGGAVEGAAYGIVPSGSEFEPPLYIVGTGTSNAGFEGFIWSEWFETQSFKDIAEQNFGLDLSGWRLTTAVSAAQTNRGDVSNLKNAAFVGSGIDPEGRTQAWMIDFGRSEFSGQRANQSWLESPAGVFDYDSFNDRFEMPADPAPLNADLVSPSFSPSALCAGSTLEFFYSFVGIEDEGGLRIEIVEEDDPDNVVAAIGNDLVSSSRTQFRAPIPTQSLSSSKRYRLRFRYFDQDEKFLSLGPLAIEQVQIDGLPVGQTHHVEGDTNGDGNVDLVDLNNVRNNFGLTGFVSGDANGDLRVDLEDLNLVRNNFGRSNCGSTVPEPAAATVSFVLIGALVLARLRRR